MVFLFMSVDSFLLRRNRRYVIIFISLLYMRECMVKFRKLGESSVNNYDKSSNI